MKKATAADMRRIEELAVQAGDSYAGLMERAGKAAAARMQRLTPEGAVVVVCGKGDPIFPLAGVKETYEIIENCYRAAGCPDNCALVIGEGGHRFYADDAWPVMKKLLAQ